MAAHQLSDEPLPTIPFQCRGSGVVVMRDSPYKILRGLFVPDSAAEKKRSGIVLAVGPGPSRSDGSRRPLDVERGDHVIWNRFAETNMTAGLPFNGVITYRKEKVDLILLLEHALQAKVSPKVSLLDHWVIVRRKKAADRSEGGIHIPDQAKTNVLHGDVVAVGPGPWGDDDIGRYAGAMTDIDVGAHVYWMQHADQTHPLIDDRREEFGCDERHELLIVGASDIIGLEPDMADALPYDPID